MIASSLTSLSVLLLVASASLPKIVVPNFPDLKITTRMTFGQFSIIQTLYLKGGWERMETGNLTGQGSTGQNSTFATINQCDQRQSFYLNPATKTYLRRPIEDTAERIKRAKPVPATDLSGADVIVSINSVDTGERKQMGSYTAGHIKTTTTVKPGPGASTPASVEERDGWYIDLPGLGCYEHIGATVSWRLSASTGLRDRVHFEQIGTGKHGYPIEETKRNTQRGLNNDSRVELLEFSQAPLDSSLFELPADYSPALRTLNGNYDMNKPDTLRNRVQEYWAELVSATRRIFR
jgi:hypothetical protein